MPISIATHQLQKQIMAPSMQQSIEVLMLPLTDLLMNIDQELQTNPLLEVIEEEEPSPLIDEELRKHMERFENMPEAYSPAFADLEAPEERPIKKEIDLEESLLQQLHIELSDPVDIKIGEFIIGNLNEDGYLKVTVEEIATALNITDHARIEQVLNTIKNLDPVGIGSRTLEECLLAQAFIKCTAEYSLVCRIIQEHLNDLGSKRYAEIARQLHLSADDVKKAAKIIATLDPRPARNHQPIDQNIYIKPDIFIVRTEDKGYQIFINEDGVPSLRISPLYRNMLSQRSLNIHEREFIKERLRNAMNFIKSIEQRGQTLRGIAEYILTKQPAFFDHGPTALVPMCMKDVAQAIGRNESTISRAVSNKYIDTPQGVFPLKFFFSQGVSEGDTGAVASRSVKEEIKDLIETESKNNPLSDQDIQDHFKKRGMTIARRTISKYRQGLRILPSHLRKQS